MENVLSLLCLTGQCHMSATAFIEKLRHSWMAETANHWLLFWILDGMFPHCAKMSFQFNMPLEKVVLSFMQLNTVVTTGVWLRAVPGPLKLWAAELNSVPSLCIETSIDESQCRRPESRPCWGFSHCHLLSL